jgi:hypothetical protein
MGPVPSSKDIFGVYLPEALVNVIVKSMERSPRVRDGNVLSLNHEKSPLTINGGTWLIRKLGSAYGTLTRPHLPAN